VALTVTGESERVTGALELTPMSVVVPWKRFIEVRDIVTLLTLLSNSHETGTVPVKVVVLVARFVGVVALTGMAARASPNIVEILSPLLMVREVIEKPWVWAT
jgi:hypothetical protein